MDTPEPQSPFRFPITSSDRRKARLMGHLSFVLAPGLRHGAPAWWRYISPILLHNFAYIGDVQSVSRLLAQGVSCEIRSRMMQTTPLMSAATQGQIAVAEVLLKAGADVNARDEYDGTALIRAAEFGHDKMIAFLLDAGADIDAIDTAFGYTALFAAALGGHLQTVQLLVNRGASTHLRMRAGLTAAEWTRHMASTLTQYRQPMLQCAKYLESL